jgi:hypothetical protein
MRGNRTIDLRSLRSKSLGNCLVSSIPIRDDCTNLVHTLDDDTEVDRNESPVIANHEGLMMNRRGVFGTDLIARALGLALLSTVLLVVGGCGTVIHEKHYFAAFDDEPEGRREPVQFYRLRVDGSTHFSNARYLTGYFDERAVSLFFNEIQAPKNQRLFDDAVPVLGLPAGTKLTPLTPSPENGAFVLIMSTNADAVANAIGSFAESQVVADAMTRMVNRDRIKAKGQSDATLAVQKAEGGALAGQIQTQLVAANSAILGQQAAGVYLRTLTTLARGLGYTGDEFASVKDARSWFDLDASRSGATP